MSSCSSQEPDLARTSGAVSLLHCHNISLPGTNGPQEQLDHAETGKGQWKIHQMIPTLTHFIPCPVVLWILGLPTVVWEDLATFLPDPQEAKNRSCLRPFLSLSLFSENFWVDERDCGLWAVRGEGLSFQISDLAQKFKFSNSHTTCFSLLGIKALPPKNGQNICCFFCLCSASLTVFQSKTLNQPGQCGCQESGGYK